MTGADILARARSAIGHETYYKLAKGGRARFWTTGGWRDEKLRCDCSGFVAWCCGTDRYRPDIPFYKRAAGGWISTTSMVRDANSPRNATGLFTRVDVPMPGDVVVYGDKGGTQGHCGIVSDVLDHKRASVWQLISVIHCAPGNYRRTGDAIQETSGAFFGPKGAIFARYEP